jgi:hypothetical protein
MFVEAGGEDVPWRRDVLRFRSATLAGEFPKTEVVAVFDRLDRPGQLEASFPIWLYGAIENGRIPPTRWVVAQMWTQLQENVLTGRW